MLSVQQTVNAELWLANHNLTITLTFVFLMINNMSTEATIKKTIDFFLRAQVESCHTPELVDKENARGVETHHSVSKYMLAQLNRKFTRRQAPNLDQRLSFKFNYTTMTLPTFTQFLLHHIFYIPDRGVVLCI